MSKLGVVCPGGIEAVCKELVFPLVKALEVEEKDGPIPSYQSNW